MKLIITELEHAPEDYLHDNSIEFRIIRHGKYDVVAAFRDGEPEDNCLARNFNDVYKIEDLIKVAYEAGRVGEPLDIEKIKTDTW